MRTLLAAATNRSNNIEEMKSKLQNYREAV
jgi:hypothetical protein